MTELLPCAFCGSEAKSGDGFMPMESIVYAYCSNNECELHSIDVGFTPETWNRRASTPAVSAEPVAEVIESSGEHDKSIYPYDRDSLVIGMKLYPHPPTVAGQDATVRDAALEEVALKLEGGVAGNLIAQGIRAMKAKP